MYRKSIMAITLAAVMVLGLTACGEKKTEGTPAVSPKKATDASFQASGELDPEYAGTIYVIGTWGNFEALDLAAQDFREYYPNIEVVYSPLSDAEQDIQNRMASGKEIDIYMHNWMDTDNGSKAFLWENAADLSEAGLNLDVLNQDMLKTGYVDGKFSMIPLYCHMNGFMVNEDLLDEYDMEVPETYDEFLECCETFKKEGIAPVLLEGNYNVVNTYNQHTIARTISSNECDTIIEEALEGKDDHGVVGDTLDLMEELKEKGYVHPESNTIGDMYEGVILRFFEGDIPFVPYDSERFSGTHKREAKSEAFTENPFTYNLIPFPGEKGYECVYDQLGSMYLGVYKGIDEEKLPYVYELLRYLFSDEGNYTMAHVKNMPSINVNAGIEDFPYFRGLRDEQIFVPGKNGFTPKYAELLIEGHTGYEDGITAEEFLGRSITYMEGKHK